MAAVSSDSLQQEIVAALRKDILGQDEQDFVVAEVFMRDGCGAIAELWIGSDAFKGLNMLKSHRLVHGALKQQMPQIHALTIHSATAEGWPKLLASKAQ